MAGAIFFSEEMLGEKCSVSGAMSQHCLSVTKYEEKDNKTCKFGGLSLDWRIILKMNREESSRHSVRNWKPF